MGSKDVGACFGSTPTKYTTARGEGFCLVASKSLFPTHPVCTGLSPPGLSTFVKHTILLPGRGSPETSPENLTGSNGAGSKWFSFLRRGGLDRGLIAGTQEERDFLRGEGRGSG